TGIFVFSRPLGTFCYIWTFFIICMPRIYGGYHYASDILAGAVIGLVCFGAVNSLKFVPQKVMPCVSFLEEKYTGIFYALAFFASYLIVTMFGDVRAVMDSMMEYLG
ncbi:MAG TPA: phosphatase PAP2 family protein, partial [Micavibrio sp.]|nr:phosphatase PAP2 family protein [Micavibrio sp.]